VPHDRAEEDQQLKVDAPRRVVEIPTGVSRFWGFVPKGMPRI
jgi:hypothetical protein